MELLFIIVAGPRDKTLVHGAADFVEDPTGAHAISSLRKTVVE